MKIKIHNELSIKHQKFKNTVIMNFNKLRIRISNIDSIRNGWFFQKNDENLKVALSEMFNYFYIDENDLMTTVNLREAD